KAVEFYPKRRVLTLAQAGLKPQSTDREIVEIASDRRWIIVTANGDDFIKEIKRYLRQTTKLHCHDLFGLVVIPNEYEIQKRILPRLEERLVFGGKHLSWKDVWDLDCCVRVTKSRAVQVTRFDRCFYCKKQGLD